MHKGVGNGWKIAEHRTIWARRSKQEKDLRSFYGQMRKDQAWKVSLLEKKKKGTREE